MGPIDAFNISRLPAIFFGAGSFAGLPQMIRSYGRHALILTGAKSFEKSGRLDALTRQLAQHDITYHLVSVPGEPTVEMIDAIAGEYRAVEIRVVASIGGGSVIDCGKAAAAMLMEKGSVKDYLENVGTRMPSGAKIPFIAVPTTAGTGSEATKNAVVCGRREGFKKISET